MDPTFPPEIYEVFIHLLQDDSKSLATCSLVSKDWLPASRSHLFRSIRVTRGRKERLHQLAQSKDATFLHHVRAVNLDFRTPDPLGPLTTLEELYEDFARMPSVTSLSLNSMYIDGPESNALFDAFPSMTDLHLSDSDFGEQYNDYYRLLPRLTALQKLTIEMITRAPNDPNDFQEDANDLQRFPIARSLRSLHLVDQGDDRSQRDEIGVMLDWLSKQSNVPELQHLHVEGVSLGSSQQLTRLLPRISDSLTHLELSLGGGEYEDTQDDLHNEFDEHINLAVLSNLRIIHLQHILGYDSNDWIYCALSQLGPSVEVIELKILISDSDTVEELNWNKIRLLFEARNLPLLRQLRICRPKLESHSSAIRQLIIANLHTYHRRAILSFHPF